ncbi:hypothetical protein Mapa_003100 [Marchantia paleacea]|nr:hypothetical protein Mapa_003100 [Marchantia paleacea]
MKRFIFIALELPAADNLSSSTMPHRFHHESMLAQAVCTNNNSKCIKRVEKQKTSHLLVYYTLLKPSSLRRKSDKSSNT